MGIIDPQYLGAVFSAAFGMLVLMYLFRELSAWAKFFLSFCICYLAVKNIEKNLSLDDIEVAKLEASARGLADIAWNITKKFIEKHEL